MFHCICLNVVGCVSVCLVLCCCWFGVVLLLIGFIFTLLLTEVVLHAIYIFSHKYNLTHLLICDRHFCLHVLQLYICRPSNEFLTCVSSLFLPCQCIGQTVTELNQFGLMFY